jgi:putative tryptophan/tyrosine transport system substrate-binding protein
MMKRREFISLLGSAAAWPLAAHAQGPAVPVVGFLHPSSPEGYGSPMRAFRQGLKDAGFVEGENVTIEYRWADNQIDRLSALAAALVRRQVAVIAVGGGSASGKVAKAATVTIPIVFVTGDDPVKQDLVTSLARPGGNLTGINIFSLEFEAKRLELLRELVPGAARVAVLVDPANAVATESTLREVDAAARAMGLQIQVFNANSSREIDAAFGTLVNERPDALFVGSGPFWIDRRVQVAQLAARHALPAIYSDRLIAEVGGLISYGASLFDAYRQFGSYTGRILKGAKPAELPVLQSTKFQLVINHPTARMLGISVPEKLLVAADEVIE